MVDALTSTDEAWLAAARVGRPIPVDEARRRAGRALRQAIPIGGLGVVALVLALVDGRDWWLRLVVLVLALACFARLLAAGAYGPAVQRLAWVDVDRSVAVAGSPTPGSAPAMRTANTEEWFDRLRRRRRRWLLVGVAVAVLPDGVGLGVLLLTDPPHVPFPVVTLVMVVATVLFAVGLGTALGMAIANPAERRLRELLSARPWTFATATGRREIVLSGQGSYTTVIAIGLVAVSVPGETVVARVIALPQGRPRPPSRRWFPVPTDGSTGQVWFVRSEDGHWGVLAAPGGAPVFRLRFLVA